MKTIQQYRWLIATGILVLIQFIQIDKANPTSKPEHDFVAVVNAPENIAKRVKHTCYDCHSNTTAYPWYTNIAPVSWWIKGHIKNGRQKLNFSEWGTYDADKRSHKLNECAEWTADYRMPLKSYGWLHPKAQMSDDERQALAQWFEAQRSKMRK